MKRFLLCLLMLCMLSCGLTQRQVHAQAADSIANAANGALPILLSRYEMEGDKAIQDSKSAEEARRRIAEIKAAWKPVWGAWEKLRLAQDAWAKALEDRGDTAGMLKALGESYCGLQEVWPKRIPVIPLGPLQCEVGATP